MNKNTLYVVLFSLILGVIYGFIVSPRVILPYTVQYWIFMAPEIVFGNLGRRVMDVLVYVLISLTITGIFTYFFKFKLKGLLITTFLPLLLIFIGPYMSFINEGVYSSSNKQDIVDIDIPADINLVYVLNESDRKILERLQYNLLKEINKNPNINGVGWKVNITPLNPGVLDRPATWKFDVNYTGDSSEVIEIAKAVLSDSGLAGQYNMVLTPFESEQKKKRSNISN